MSTHGGCCTSAAAGAAHLPSEFQEPLMEFLLLPSLLLLLLHAGAIRIWEHQEDRIFGIPVF